MAAEMSYIDGVVQVIVNLAPLFLLLTVLFIIFSWIRLLIDVMSGRGM